MNIALRVLRAALIDVALRGGDDDDRSCLLLLDSAAGLLRTNNGSVCVGPLMLIVIVMH